jgi:signal transduction histidine kinase
MRAARYFNGIFFFNATVGLLSLLTISVVFYFLMRTALIDRTLDQLQSVNTLKASQINSHLRDKNGIVGEEDFNKIQVMLLENTGMGETGESYIVGPDNRLRSASRFFPDRPPATMEFKQDAVNPDHIRIDYRGKKVISFSRDLENTSLQWKLVSEIDFDEATEPVEEFTNYLVAITITGSVLIVLVSAFFSNVVSQREAKLHRDKTAALIEGQENERKRITQELHDGVGQLLTAIRLRIDVIQFDNGPRKELVDLINETIAEVKRISYNVMPGSLVDFGLEAALKGLCDNTAKYSRLKCDFKYVHESDHTLSFEVTAAVFRIAQEGFNNILKHASAANIELHVLDKEDEIYVLLKDDGIGFDTQHRNNAGLGLRSMKERAKLLGGKVDIHSAPGEGTVIEVHLPV